MVRLGLDRHRLSPSAPSGDAQLRMANLGVTALIIAGTLLAPAAQHQQLDQGLAFGLGNLAWAAGQAIAASGSGALAQATSDLVPYSLLATACLLTLSLLRIKHRSAGLLPRVHHLRMTGLDQSVHHWRGPAIQ